MKFAAGDVNGHGSAGPAYNSELVGYSVIFEQGFSPFEIPAVIYPML